MLTCNHCRSLILESGRYQHVGSFQAGCRNCGAVYKVNITEIAPPKLEGRELIEVMNVNQEVKKRMLKEWDEQHKPPARRSTDTNAV